MAVGATAALLLAPLLALLLAPLAHGMECPNEGWCSSICTGSRVKQSILHSALGWSSARHQHFVLGCIRCHSAACSTGGAMAHGKSIPQAAGRQSVVSPTDPSERVPGYVHQPYLTTTPTTEVVGQTTSTAPTSGSPASTTPVSPTATTLPTAPPPADMQGCLVNGVIRPLFSTTTSSSNCMLYVCTEDGATTIDLSGMCMPEPQDLGECVAYQRPDQCCFNYNCTLTTDTDAGTCVDENGVVRQGGEVWHDNDQYPCVSYVCTHGQLQVLSDMRPLCSTAPNDECVPYRLPGQCCQNFNCSVVQHETRPCLFEPTGVAYQHLEQWYDSEQRPCIKYVCVLGTVYIVADRRDSCLPPPLEGCRESLPSAQCCDVYSECPCMVQGVVHQHGTMFPDNVNHPCHVMLCTNFTVTTVNSIECEPLDCSQTIWPDGQCCRECAGCVVDGVRYQEGSTWVDSTDRPCTTFQCVDSQVVTIEVVPCMPAPRPSCTPWYNSGVCCPKWDCFEGPCEFNGATHEHGTTWPDDPLRPCIIYRCNNSVVEVEHEQPDCPPSPGTHCLEREVPYQCCPAYDCLNFTCPYKDRTYQEGDVWVDDPQHPCKWYQCLRTGVSVVNVTSCPPLNPPDCITKRPLGSCCKVCTFSDITLCRDEFGNPRLDGDIYYKDAAHCLLVRCVNTTEVSVVDLSQCCQPPPAPNCFVSGVADCCPVFTCPDTFCLDNNGLPRGNGEIYYKDSAQCVVVRCEDNTEVTLLDKTTTCELPPDNHACTHAGVYDCCPIYDCPDYCSYEGQPHAIGSTWWDDPQRQCVQYLCKPYGVVVELQNKLPCPNVRTGCTPVRQPPACCHFKYTCMFDVDHSLIAMQP